ncbi:alpha/beta fold hydrolase [Rhodovibrio salinarum]|uniref:Alpha/beta hydrolase n=1 Tax=Rhodovibrio salinarum TaxID=1087 RepID=A0A934V0W8_9PROT|nr:alpha/beta fold hydrolase [Rhodovibrio salinarum]MBK1698757.1 alpha/beta hydrolase [Rhodovibrio salinarum]
MTAEPPQITFDGPQDGPVLALAHGAGVGMDSPFMAAMAELLAARGVRVARFEFGYMAERRAGGKKRPPPAQNTLLAEFRAVIDALGGPGSVVVGGKSMGGRMASLLAADQEQTDQPVAGVVALGYPFHPPGKPEKLRTEHLQALATSMLVCQGERDPFGTAEEVATYPLSAAVQLTCLPDGDHDLKPRKSSGYSAETNWATAADTVAAFLRGHT